MAGLSDNQSNDSMQYPVGRLFGFSHCIALERPGDKLGQLEETSGISNLDASNLKSITVT